MIIVCGGTKGGTGKSTTAVNLAVIAASEGGDVLLVDADDQESASDFSEFFFAFRALDEIALGLR